jgi:hypothetical protein
MPQCGSRAGLERPVRRHGAGHGGAARYHARRQNAIFNRRPRSRLSPTEQPRPWANSSCRPNQASTKRWSAPSRPSKRPRSDAKAWLAPGRRASFPRVDGLPPIARPRKKESPLCARDEPASPSPPCACRARAMRAPPPPIRAARPAARRCASQAQPPLVVRRPYHCALFAFRLPIVCLNGSVVCKGRFYY